jgi:hypothetical protein
VGRALASGADHPPAAAGGSLSDLLMFRFGAGRYRQWNHDPTSP